MSLKRELGVVGATMMGLGSIIGTGVWVAYQEKIQERAIEEHAHRHIKRQLALVDTTLSATRERMSRAAQVQIDDDDWEYPASPPVYATRGTG